MLRALGAQTQPRNPEPRGVCDIVCPPLAPNAFQTDSKEHPHCSSVRWTGTRGHRPFLKVTLLVDGRVWAARSSESPRHTRRQLPTWPVRKHAHGTHTGCSAVCRALDWRLHHRGLAD